jgi:predicted amidophosphoribosyltransferase
MDGGEGRTRRRTAGPEGTGGGVGEGPPSRGHLGWLAGSLALLERFLLPAGCLACRGWLPDPDRLLCPGCATRLLPVPHPRCPRCGGPRSAGSADTTGTRGPAPPPSTCRDCRDWPAVLERAAQATLLDGPARSLVHALKYEGWPEAGRIMAAAMAPLLPPDGPWRSALLVPVPTSTHRARRRGLQPGRRPGAGALRRDRDPLAFPLRRVREGGTQVALHPEERRANVRGAFQLDGRESGSLEGRRVILVDDVLTTGATAGEVAAVLEGAGVTGVLLLAFARTPADRRLDPAAGPQGSRSAPGTPLEAVERALGRRARRPVPQTTTIPPSTPSGEGVQ